jgi:hypothetical protein
MCSDEVDALHASQRLLHRAVEIRNFVPAGGDLHRIYNQPPMKDPRDVLSVVLPLLEQFMNQLRPSEDLPQNVRDLAPRRLQEGLALGCEAEDQHGAFQPRVIRGLKLVV